MLNDTGSVETTGIPLIGGGTEHVSVAMPGADADDDLDDDVTDDEVAYELPADVEAEHFAHDEPAADEPHADGQPVAETDPEPEFAPVAEVEAEPEPIADPEFDTAPSAPDAAASAPYAWWRTDLSAPRRTAPAVHDEPAASVGPETAEGEIIDDEPAASASAPAAADDDIVDAVEHTDTGATPAAAAESTPVAPAPVPEAAAPAPATPAPAPAAPAPTSAAPAPAPAAPAPTSAAPAPASAAPAAAAAVAATAAAPRERSRAVERVTTRREQTTLTSKRLGEFEGSRESADLLTADRLLDPAHVRKPEPEGAWQHFVYSITGHRVNLGDSKRARARKDLDRRIAAPLNGGARFVPVMSRKGGVGKTTVTMLLGMALADARDDRIIAIDANPDRGTLAERIERASGKTVRDLVRMRAEVAGYNDLSTVVARDETRLDVLASDTDPRVSEAFSDADYHDVASLAAHYYSIVLTDTGTGIVHSVMGATLDLADQLVVVAGLTVDEARLASETLTWLETNGYSDQVRSAVVVLNNARPGASLVRADELEQHFRSRVRTVVRMPYDPHIAAGSAITFRDLHASTREAARALAASVVEGLRTPAIAA